jgi:metal-responsive CopG/Arc/MetJ family transcriptional regulator|tara:strand:+ start:1529 stop:1756 length:228 start_codon:yes stop_codon:yes gene_type:complete
MGSKHPKVPTFSVRARLDVELLSEVDSYITRYRTRTQIIEEALRLYLPVLAQTDKRKKIEQNANSSSWRDGLLDD